MSTPRSLSPLPRRAILRAALVCTAVLAGAGCGGEKHLVAQRVEVITPGGARVSLKNARGPVIELEVFNYTPAPMVVYRDNIMLSSSQGLRPRLPGGVSNVYTVAPGGVHQVNVKYDLHGLRRGETVAVVFQNAFIVNSQSVPVEPIPFLVE